MATFEIELLAEPVHKGRPKDEEPHVKRVPIKKENDSGIEYIVRFDLVSQIETVNLLEKKLRYDLSGGARHFGGWNRGAPDTIWGEHLKFVSTH